MNSAVKIFLVSELMLTALAGCASSQRPPGFPAAVAPSPPPPPPPAPPPKKVKLVLLLAERFLLPNVAIALNEKMVRAEVPGVDERTIAPISMETAQGQAECAQANDECYVKVARLLSGDRLLWAEMERAGGTKKKGPVKVVVQLFDAEKGAVIGRAEEALKKDIVDDSLERLIGRAVSTGNPTTPAPPSAPPRSATPPLPSWPPQPSSAPPSPAPAPPSWPPQPAPAPAPPSWPPQPAPARPQAVPAPPPPSWPPQPTPQRPAASQPAPSQPAPSQPAPSQPAPSQPAPSQPAPSLGTPSVPPAQTVVPPPPPPPAKPAQ